MRTAPGTDPVKLLGLKLNFLSPVTEPAHEGAVALLLKRRDFDPKTGKARHRIDDEELVRRRKKRQKAKDDEAEKFADSSTAVVMTSSIDGHAHLLHLEGRAGTSTWQKSEGEENGHDHPFMLTVDEAGGFSVEIGDSEGHSHAVDSAALNAAFAAAALGKTQPEDDMPEKTDKTAEEIQALEESLALTRLFVGFNDAARTHFENLDEVGKRVFATKGEIERTVEIAKSLETDVVYKDSAGAVYRKSDDPRLIELAKRADEDRKVAKADREALEQERLEKRAADELAGLPGTATEKAAALRALEAIPNQAHREAALKAIKAGGAAISAGFDTLGTTEVQSQLGLDVESDDPNAQLEVLAREHAKTNKVSLGKAYREVTKTDAGRKLYAAVQKATMVPTQ